MSTPLHPLNPQTQCLSTETLLSYADGRLEGKDAHRVERHLAGCPLCADALEGIEMIGTAAFTSLLNEVEIAPKQQHAQPANKGRVLNFTRIAAAITSVAAVILVVMMVLPSGPAGIAGDYYSTPEGSTLRGGRPVPENPKSPTMPGGDTQREMSLLMNKYNEQQFEEAAAGLSQINTSDAQFYAGAAYIEIQQYDKAIVSLQRVVELNDSFVMDAKWNLGLAHLFKGDKAAGLKIMREIADEEDNDYNKKAKEILKKLE